jgi:hypothetical protein
MAGDGERTGRVTRTFRASVRIGEDFFTIEESVTLPLEAGDEDIEEAVALGWSIYQAQREAFAAQVAAIREAHAPAPTPMTVRDPDAPASEKQRQYIHTLQETLNWNSEDLAAHAGRQGIDITTMTRGEASSFIDSLKKVAEERAPYQSGDDEQAAITERQQRVLEKLAQERGVALEAEVQRRFECAVESLTRKQAGTLITEWQRR